MEIILVRRMLYLIEILHQTTTSAKANEASTGCILSKFYIKPQREHWLSVEPYGCILSKFYIKPQPKAYDPFPLDVVSYRNSTSNHNAGGKTAQSSRVVSYRNSTSNHNTEACFIKRAEVVSYRNSTSNHNCFGPYLFASEVVSYRNSTSNHNTEACFIKRAEVVSYRNSTSNHNFVHFHLTFVWLYLIEILHQTTTYIRGKFSEHLLYLIEILHQTTTSGLILIDKVLLTGCLPL